MPHGKAARKRNWQQASKAKVAARKAQKRAAKAATMDPQPRPLVIPTVTEDDLLSFQFAHFGDDTKPDTFFVDPQQALNYQPGLEQLGDDGLGWYEDGVKRTLTDEQIEMFRHTELEELMKQRKLEAEAMEEYSEDDDDDEYEPTIPDGPLAPAPVSQSPVSDASSLEDELSTKPTTSTVKQRQPKKFCGSTDQFQTPNERQRTRSPRRKPRKKEIPYDQRNKRKWENYIDGEDPVHGSMTHRRLVRELDEQRGKNITIDYGDDEGVAPPPTRSTAGPSRKIISYEDD